MGLPFVKDEEIYTYGDYALWPEDERWELIDGIAWNMSAAPNPRHQILLGNLYMRFREFFDRKPCEVFLSPFDVLLPDYPEEPEIQVRNVVQPDLAVVCDPSKITEKNCFGPPDLVVEILSPSTAKKDMNEKFLLYKRQDIKEYWIIDGPARYIHIYTLTDGRYREPAMYSDSDTVKSGLFPSFQFPAAEVFERSGRDGAAVKIA